MAIDHAVAAAIARRKAAPQGLRGWRLAWPALAIGAAAALVAAIVLRPALEAPRQSDPASAPIADGSAAPSAGARSFLPLVPMAEIERAGDAWVVPAQLSRVALAQYGLPVDPARLSEAIDTELLMRRDGAVLAIRLTQ